MKVFAKVLGVLLLAGIAFLAGWGYAKGPAAIVALTSKDGGYSDQWRKLETVKQFDQLLGSVQAIRDMVVAEAVTEQEAVQGMRWILRDLAMVTDITADANVTRPAFARMDTDARKAGGDNPDGEYGLATIDGRYDYIIKGNRGSVTYFSLNVNAGRGVSDRRLDAFLNDKTIELDAQGNFTLLLSKTKPEVPGQWVKISEDATSVMLRQYILDRAKEQLVEMDIAVLGDDPGILLPDDEQMAEQLSATQYAFMFLASLHKLVLPEALDNPNVFLETDSDSLGGSISGPDNLYMIGHYAIADDEALVVKIMPPEARYWNFAVESIWHESVDWMHRPTSLTKAEVDFEADGSVRFVIAKSDPGVANWLDTAGVNRGFMTFRWLEARDKDVPRPTVNLVKLNSL